MKYYTLTEAAEILGMSKSRLWRYIKDGKIKAEKRQGRGCIVENIIPETEIPIMQNRRGSGRPKGAKNKPKQPAPENTPEK